MKEYTYVIKFYDQRHSYGVFETNTDPKLIEKLLDEYRASEEDCYNIGDFSNILTEKGIKGHWHREPNTELFF